MKSRAVRRGPFSPPLLRLIHSKLASNVRGCVTGFGRFGIVETARPYQQNRSAESGRAHFWVSSKPGPEHRTQADLQTMRLGNGSAPNGHGGSITGRRNSRRKAGGTTGETDADGDHDGERKRGKCALIHREAMWCGSRAQNSGADGYPDMFLCYKNTGSGGEAPPPDTPALALTDGGRPLRFTA